MLLAAVAAVSNPYTSTVPVVVAQAAPVAAVPVSAAAAEISGPAGLSALALVVLAVLAVFGMAVTHEKEAWEPGQLALVAAPVLLAAAAPQPAKNNACGRLA